MTQEEGQAGRTDGRDGGEALAVAPWAPIERQLLESSVWEADPVVRVLWVAVLLIASEPGRRGLIDMTVRALAARACLPPEDTERALAVLMAPDPQSRSREAEGRRLVLIDQERPWGWKLVTWERRQDLRARSMATLRKQRQRERSRSTEPAEESSRHAPSRPVTPGHDAPPREGEGEREGERKGDEGEPGEPEGGSRPSAPPGPLRSPFALFLDTYPKRSSGRVSENVFELWRQLSPEERQEALSAVDAFAREQHRDLRSVPNADAWLASGVWRNERRSA